MQVGWVKIGDFRRITGFISKTVQDRHILPRHDASRGPSAIAELLVKIGEHLAKVQARRWLSCALSSSFRSVVARRTFVYNSLSVTQNIMQFDCD